MLISIVEETKRKLWFGCNVVGTSWGSNGFTLHLPLDIPLPDNWRTPDD